MSVSSTRLPSPSEYFTDAEPSSLIREVQEAEERRRQAELTDLTLLRAAEDWNFLSDKTVGV